MTQRLPNRPLRIAHVTATFPPYYGGTGNVCYHNARVLAALGHEVRVLTAAWPGTPDDPDGVSVHRFRPLVRVGNAPVLPGLLPALRGADLVHLHYPFYAGAELVALSRRPYVVTYHQDVELAGWLGRATKLHERTIGRRLLRGAARLCPTSLDYLAYSTVAGVVPPDRIEAVPNGVDAERYAPGPPDPALRRRHGLPDDLPLVLFVGAMDQPHYFKGVPTLLRALAAVPRVAALLVGDGDLRPVYERLRDDLGLGARVAFAGRVSADDLPATYRAADFLVLPSETRGEAFGLVLIEALASGRPVIATDLPGVRSVVAPSQDGLLVPPANPAALAAAIAQIATLPPAERAAMGERGRRKVEQTYTWDRIGARLDRLYRTVLRERAAR